MYVIKILGFANGAECPHAGAYLKSFDHEADNGRGYGEFTPELANAMRFSGKNDALLFYLKVPRCKPKREDGKPNRPLTAATVEILHADADPDY